MIRVLIGGKEFAIRGPGRLPVAINDGGAVEPAPPFAGRPDRFRLPESPLHRARRGRGFSIDEKFRGQAYAEMTKIVLEDLPWIIVVHPVESYGVRKAVDWTPYSNQQIELRAFNLKRA